MPLSEARPAARKSIDSALNLAPDDFMVLFQNATILLFLDLDYSQAEATLKQLLKQRPKDAKINSRLARIALREGRKSESLRQLISAQVFSTDLAAEEVGLLDLTAWVRLVAGDYEGVLKASGRGLKLAPGGNDRALLLRDHIPALIKLGRIQEAKSFVEEAWALNGSTRPERFIAFFANIGETEKAKKILDDSPLDLVDHFELAVGYLALNDVDNTFKSIRVGIENHNQHLLESLLIAEWWDPIRDDPRFDDMLKLLDSKVTHTKQYLLDHDTEEADQQ